MMKKSVIASMVLIVVIIAAQTGVFQQEKTVWAEENAYKIVVNRTENYVTIYQKDEQGKYKQPVQKMPCSTAEDVASTPLGKFQIGQKKEWRENKDKTYSQYACKITDTVWFVGSLYKSKSGGDMITESYNKLGEPGAAGSDCIMLSVKDAKWIYDNCQEGTAVHIFIKDEDSKGIETAASIKIPEDHKHAKWDPTDSNSRNPWLNEKPQINGAADITVGKGENVNLMNGVTALDICGNDITSQVIVTGGGDTSQPGEYLVNYFVTDITGASASVDVKLKIVDGAVTQTTTQPQRPGSTSSPTRGGVLQEEEGYGFGTVLGIVAVAFVLAAVITRWATK